METLQTSFIDTLNLLILPKKEDDILYYDSIQNQLKELEGDYHTFLFKDNVIKLIKSGFINEASFETIELIHKKISSIDATLWGPNEFIENDEWKAIRELVINLFSKNLI